MKSVGKYPSPRRTIDGVTGEDVGVKPVDVVGEGEDERQHVAHIHGLVVQRWRLGALAALDLHPHFGA